MTHRWLAVLTLCSACSSDGAGPAPRPPAAPPVQEARTEVPPPRDPGVEARDGIAFGQSVQARGPAAWAFVARAGARVRVNPDNGATFEIWGPRRSARSWAGAARLVSQDEVFTLPAAGAYLLVSRGDEESTRTLMLDCADEDCRAECGPPDGCPVGSWCRRVVCVQAPCPSFCEPQELEPRR